MSAETEPIDFLEPSNLGSRSLDGSAETDSSLGNGWFPKELKLPTKPLSFALGNLLKSPGIDPESALTRDIYISVGGKKKKECMKWSGSQKGNAMRGKLQIWMKLPPNKLTRESQDLVMYNKNLNIIFPHCNTTTKMIWPVGDVCNTSMKPADLGLVD